MGWGWSCLLGFDVKGKSSNRIYKFKSVCYTGKNQQNIEKTELLKARFSYARLLCNNDFFRTPFDLYEDYATIDLEKQKIIIAFVFGFQKVFALTYLYGNRNSVLTSRVF